ncbi:MAG TPA: ribose-phosphate pyrophosphokinase [Verrucomicrobiae bacterium]|jgi:ribose-phosphate pyrophosphokinase|nr:ribose-phosphate pyrophosphokinase [Verrucomicrobiae bacterium]
MAESVLVERLKAECGDVEPRSVGLSIASGSTDPAFAEKVATELGVDPVEVERRKFLDGELFVRYGDSLRGTDTFLIQSHYNRSTRYPDWSPNDAIQEHVFMIDAAIGASAMHVSAVAPWFGYSRQDKKDDGRVPIAARRVVRQLLSAGAERLISMDLHAPQIQGFTGDNEPFENIFASKVLLDHIKNWATDKDPENIVVVSPDEGRVKLNNFYVSELNEHFGQILGEEDFRGVKLAIVNKDRSPDSSQVRAMSIIGDVRGKDCVEIDDMIDTAKTLCASADAIMHAGAASVIAAATHPVFSGDAVEHLANSVFERIIVTDTISQEAIKDELPTLEIASVTSSFAEVIWRIHHNQSVSSMFRKQRAEYEK